jgi:Transposase DDE domain group 1
MLYSEFRDGNVPAGHEQLRVLKESLQYLPASVTKVSLRSDTAGYQEELLLYCGEGKDARFGVIEFAIGADVTEAFRAAVVATAASEWKPLIRMFDGKPQPTDQEWAEICYVPAWAGHSKKRADYRFLAIREPLRQLELFAEARLPFPTLDFATKGTYKLFGVVTNKKQAGDQVIWWLRERCGKSEEVHAALKSDLAGGQLPSGRFGANAAWWALAVLAHNLNAAMKKLALGQAWGGKRMKALRFRLIALPGRVVSHARKLIIRLGAGARNAGHDRDRAPDHSGAALRARRMTAPARATASPNGRSASLPGGGVAPCRYGGDRTRDGCSRPPQTRVACTPN